MIMRWRSLPSTLGAMLLIVSSAAAADPCKPYKLILQYGADYFEDASEVSIGSDIARGNYLLPGAQRCILDRTVSKYDSKYVCTYLDGNEQRLPQLKARARSLAAEIETCLAVKNIFGFSRSGRRTPRYMHARMLGSYDDETFSIWWNDRYSYSQDVELELADRYTASDQRLFELRLTIKSK
jgi:hypothetical protein